MNVVLLVPHCQCNVMHKYRVISLSKLQFDGCNGLPQTVKRFYTAELCHYLHGAFIVLYVICIVVANLLIIYETLYM